MYTVRYMQKVKVYHKEGKRNCNRCQTRVKLYTLGAKRERETRAISYFQKTIYCLQLSLPFQKKAGINPSGFVRVINSFHWRARTTYTPSIAAACAILYRIRRKGQGTFVCIHIYSYVRAYIFRISCKIMPIPVAYASC